MLPTGSFAESIDGRCTFEEIKYVDSLFSVQPGRNEAHGR
jgi:hypothetical protein